MTQTERREYLISALLKEQPKHGKIVIPASEQEQKRLLRSLFNIRLPRAAAAFWRCRMLICRRKSGGRELQI